MTHAEALTAYERKEYKRAFEIWEREAERENDQAMANLGLMYLKGEGIPKDMQQAKAWFEKASVYDNASANYNLGLMYHANIGVEENVNIALDYFRRAAQKEHQGANFRLGLILLKDRTNESTLLEGFNCMMNAAKSGHMMAKTQVGGINANADKACEQNLAFRALEKEKQKENIEAALAQHIRPVLEKDGGDITVVDFANEPEIEIKLMYKGKCVGCSLAATSTYGLIRSTIAKTIDENIRVYVL